MSHNSFTRRRMLTGTISLAAMPLLWSPLAAAQAGTIQFGQSASLTGGQARYGAEVRDGIRAAFAAANRAGGSKFELVSLDDGGDRERCKANVKSLIESGVVALLGLTSGAAAEACLTLADEAKIVMLGTASGNMGIREASATAAFHVRASYAEEYAAMARYIKDFGMTRVGYVYLRDTSAANQRAMTGVLEKAGIAPTVTVALDRNTKTFDAEAQQLLAGKLDCILFTTNSAPIAQIVDAINKNGGYHGLYFATSFAGQPLIDDMASRGRSMILTQVVPRPNSITLPLIKQYQADLAAFDSKLKPGYTTLEGYVAGRVAVEAARGGREQLTRARFKERLLSLNVDLGGYVVRFAGVGNSGSRFVEVVAVDRRGNLVT